MDEDMRAAYDQQLDVALQDQEDGFTGWWPGAATAARSSLATQEAACPKSLCVVFLCYYIFLGIWRLCNHTCMTSHLYRTPEYHHANMCTCGGTVMGCKGCVVQVRLGGAP